MQALQRIHQRLIDEVYFARKKTILEYGCGRGYLVNQIFKQIGKPLHVVAVDSDELAVEECRKNCEKHIADGSLEVYVCSDPKELSGKFFDVIFCHNVLECIEHKEIFIEDLHALLSHDGTLILSHVDFDSAIYEHRQKALSREMVHGFAHTKQPWQKFHDGQMGRKISSIVRHLKIGETIVYEWTLNEDRFNENQYGYLLSNMIKETYKGIFSQELLQNWQKDLAESALRGEYSFKIDVFFARIRKKNHNK